MTIADDTTAEDLHEALHHLVVAARDAASDPKSYDVWHRRIDRHLDALELLYGVAPTAQSLPHPRPQLTREQRASRQP